MSAVDISGFPGELVLRGPNALDFVKPHATFELSGNTLQRVNFDEGNVRFICGDAQQPSLLRIVLLSMYLGSVQRDGRWLFETLIRFKDSIEVNRNSLNPHMRKFLSQENDLFFFNGINMWQTLFFDNTRWREAHASASVMYDL